MHAFSVLFSAAAALLPATYADPGVGTAYIKNNCDSDVWVQSVDGTTLPKQKIPSGQPWSEPYRNANNGGGVSLKVGINEDLQDITQFEYTRNDTQRRVWYDISHLNSKDKEYPFSKSGENLGASDPSCPVIACPAGKKICDEAYNYSDQIATHDCELDADVTFTLCPNGGPVGRIDDADAGSSSAASLDGTATTLATSYGASAPSSAAVSSAAVSSAAVSTAVESSSAPTVYGHSIANKAVMHGNTVTVTEFATAAVTVAAKEKRDHRHEHHHRHPHARR